jgi:hypothetical protein
LFKCLSAGGRSDDFMNTLQGIGQKLQAGRGIVDDENAGFLTCGR